MRHAVETDRRPVRERENECAPLCPKGAGRIGLYVPKSFPMLGDLKWRVR